MVPPLLIAAFVLALAVRMVGDRRMVLSVVVLALVWGVLVGVADTSAATFAAGTAVGLANVAVGAAAGRLLVLVHGRAGRSRLG